MQHLCITQFITQCHFYAVSHRNIYTFQQPRILLNATIGKVVLIDGSPVDFTVGLRYNVSGYPQTLQYPGTPRGWGTRAQITFLMGH